MTPLLAGLLACADEARRAAPPPDAATLPVAPTGGPTLLRPIDDAALLTRVSLDLRGVRPSLDELALLEEGTLLGPDGPFDALVDAWLEDPRFGERLIDLWDDVWSSRTGNYYVHFEVLSARTGLSEHELIGHIAEEPLRLLATVALQDLPYETFVTADWTLADEVLAEFQPVDYPAGASGWRQVRYTDGRPPVGVLATNATWWLHGSMENNRNRNRANFVARALLCDDYLEREVPALDGNLVGTPEGLAEAIETDPACVSCHHSLDPLASHFYGFWWFDLGAITPDVYTVYHPEREWLWRDLTGVEPGFFGQPSRGLADLGRLVAEDPRYAKCFVEQSWELLTRTDRDDVPVDLDPLEEAFDEGGHRIKHLLRAIVSDPVYQGADERFALKRVSPSLLSSSVEDLTGYRWTSPESGRDRGLLAPRRGLRSRHRARARAHRERHERPRGPAPGGRRRPARRRPRRLLGRGPPVHRGRLHRDPGRGGEGADGGADPAPPPPPVRADDRRRRARGRARPRVLERRQRGAGRRRGEGRLGRPPLAPPPRPLLRDLLMPRPSLTRRDLLRSAAAGVALAAAPPARGAVAGADRKFVFVGADGGWDVTKVFAPLWSSTIHHDPAEEEARAGSLRYVSHPGRPAVDRFYQRHASRIATVDGLLVRSVNHPVCRSLWMTGSASAARPDWPSLLGFEAKDRYTVPQLIVAGYDLSGELSPYTAFSGADSALADLLTGRSALTSRPRTVPFPSDLADLADRELAERVADRVARSTTDLERALHGAHLESATRLAGFKAATEGVDLSAGSDFLEQVDLAATVLASGISRCVQLRSTDTLRWDTHVENDRLQNDLLQDLFVGLERLLALLETTPGAAAPTLLDEVTVVVHSEMGRTPYLNNAGGKEHWMYTSALLVGSGVRGGTQVGGYDDTLDGLTVDPSTGEPDPGGAPLTPDALGATLLTLADVDPARYLGADLTIRTLLG